MNNENPFAEIGKVLNNIIEDQDKNPSNYYYNKAKESENLLERSVYQTIAGLFFKCQEDVLQVIELLESSKSRMILNAGVEKSDKRDFYERAADLYEAELQKIYKGEI